MQINNNFLIPPERIHDSKLASHIKRNQLYIANNKNKGQNNQTSPLSPPTSRLKHNLTLRTLRLLRGESLSGI